MHVWHISYMYMNIHTWHKDLQGGQRTRWHTFIFRTSEEFLANNILLAATTVAASLHFTLPTENHLCANTGCQIGREN